MERNHQRIELTFVDHKRCVHSTHTVSRPNIANDESFDTIILKKYMRILLLTANALFCSRVHLSFVSMFYDFA